MARFEDSFKQEVRDRTDLVDLVSQYVRLEKRGQRYWGLCPFHSEKSPSFSVVPDQQFYHCFGCKATGDAFRFLMEKEHVDFPEALVTLAQRAGLSVPRADGTPAQKAATQEREQVYEALEFAARFYEHNLWETPGGQEVGRYVKARGLTPQTARQFRLGYAPQRWDALVRAGKSRFRPAVLVKAGLVRAREQQDGFYDLFRHRLMFPIRDVRGRVVGFGGRAIEAEQKPKYYNSPEGPYFSKRQHLFGIDQGREAMRAEDQGIIVEGYVDAVSLHQAGFRAAVASLGTALTADQAQLVRRQCRRVFIAYDADAAGQAATLRGLDLLSGAGCDVRIVQLPKNHDPDDLIRASGPAAFQAVLNAALPLTEFKLQQALAAHQNAGNPAETKARVVADLLPLLAGLQEFAVLQDEYIKKIANELQVTEESLRIDVKRYLDKTRQNASPRYTDSRNWNNIKVLGVSALTGREPRWQAERTVLRILFHHPHLWGEARPALATHPWTDENHADLYAAMARCGRESERRLAVLLGDLEDAAQRELVAALAGEARYIAEPERELAEALARLAMQGDKERLQELKAVFQERESGGQVVEPALLLEYQDLLRRTRR